MVRRRRLERRLPGCADDGEQLPTRGCKQRDRGIGASAAAGSSSPLDNWYGAAPFSKAPSPAPLRLRSTTAQCGYQRQQPAPVKPAPSCVQLRQRRYQLSTAIIALYCVACGVCGCSSGDDYIAFSIWGQGANVKRLRC